mgnify:FL=1
MKIKQYLKKNLFSIISFLLAIVIMLSFVISTKGFSQLVNITQHKNLFWLFMAFGSMALYWFLEGMVIFVYTKKLYPENSMTASFNVGMIGLLYSALTPFSTGGQPMQMYVMKKQGLDSGKSVSILAMKSIVYQVSLAVYSVIAMIVCFHFFNENIPGFSFLSMAGLSVNLLIIILMLIVTLNQRWTKKIVNWVVCFLHFIHVVKDKETTEKRMEKQTACFHESAMIFKGDFAVQCKACLFSLLEFTFLFLVPYCIFRYFGFDGVVVIQMIAAQAFINMISSFIPIPGAAGVAEGSFYVFFSLFFPANAIVPAILLWRLITYCGTIVLGTLMVFLENQRIRRQKKRNVVEGK